MHRKRVTSELHDSYFRLMTIKHPISKIQWAIVWALNYYLTQLSSGCQSSCQRTSRELGTRCGGEGRTRPGVPWKAPMELTPTSGERGRHGMAVIAVGSGCGVCVRSPAPSRMRTLSSPFGPLRWGKRWIFFWGGLLASLSCVVCSCVCLWCCVVVMLKDDVDDYITVLSIANTSNSN